MAPVIWRVPRGPTRTVSVSASPTRETGRVPFLRPFRCLNRTGSLGSHGSVPFGLRGGTVDL